MDKGNIEKIIDSFFKIYGSIGITGVYWYRDLVLNSSDGKYRNFVLSFVEIIEKEVSKRNPSERIYGSHGFDREEIVRKAHEHGFRE